MLASETDKVDSGQSAWDAFSEKFHLIESEPQSLSGSAVLFALLPRHQASDWPQSLTSEGRGTRK